MDRGAEQGAWPRVDAIPFESEHRFMATLHRDAGGAELLFVKGAPEVVLEHCDRQQGRDGRQAPMDRERFLAASDALLARLAARDLFEGGLQPVGLLAGDGPEAWRAAGHAIVATPDAPPDAERIDHLFFTHDRHEGNRAAAQRYLDWELALVGQLDAQERAEFRV